MTENEEELQSPVMKVKKDSEKVAIKKIKIMALGPITS